MNLQLDDYDRECVCKHCGERGKAHGSYDNPHRPFACPGRGTFPKWPKLKDDKKAGELYDKRLVRFWNQRKTSFARAF